MNFFILAKFASISTWNRLLELDLRTWWSSIEYFTFYGLGSSRSTYRPGLGPSSDDRHPVLL